MSSNYLFQEVLWDDPPISECEATSALFYSISSTQVSSCFVILVKNKLYCNSVRNAAK